MDLDPNVMKVLAGGAVAGAVRKAWSEPNESWKVWLFKFFSSFSASMCLGYLFGQWLGGEPAHYLACAYMVSYLSDKTIGRLVDSKINKLTDK